MITRSKSKNHVAFSSSLCLLASAASADSTEPQNYQAAAQSPTWQAAMLDEYQALQKQGTWSLVTLPPDKQAIGCKWVFRLKRNSDGSIARHKARLVAKGFLQTKGVDYHETFIEKQLFVNYNF
ncbi:uncharacterized protein LOC114315645 [Camellia sinensis]|uniref:uncharacterized protein LOC114315645 n=1 Tax=Camellia sinensis TaxID=4442 RepID=UPI001036510B|nr:uncharacterized protein LOC114315645 [Camellia sinensis]